jgi:shikimate dehydrogenase
MKKSSKKQLLFGLIGKNINYSFSKKYFNEKFRNNHFDNCEYQNFDIQNVNEFLKIISDTKKLKGLNVTIPYKEEIIPFVDKISKKAKIIGAVNCIKILKNKKTKGFNTDYYGFKKALKPIIKSYHKKALILGTGGASKAVAFALKKMKIEYDFVSRNPTEFQYRYSDLNKAIFEEYQIIINTSPVGTFPNINESPALNYYLFTKKHIAFDLIYNPEESEFLKKAKLNGAKTKNGYEMLVLQAERAWKIWNQ